MAFFISPARTQVIYIIILLVLSIFSVNARAETINLKSGKIIEGKIIEKTAEYIKIEVEGIPVTYYKDQLSPASDSKPVEVSAAKSLKYKITQKFYLKGLQDTHFLKFCTVVPRKDVSGQKISNLEIFPKPNTTFTDSDGNEIIVYYNSLLKSGASFITGFSYDLELESLPLKIDSSSANGNYSSLDDSFKKYLGKEEDIDPANILIKEKAESLCTNINNPYLKAKAIYDFITDNVSYDYALLEQLKFNSGAYGSRSPQDMLTIKKGICYDIAKFFVALSRSANVPARVVRGLAFQPEKGKSRYVEEYGHAWAEIYLPKYGWVAVDPTFGISKKEDFFCFNYTSHIVQDYGLSQMPEFGSLEKGWTIQFRTQSVPTSSPVGAAMQVEIISDSGKEI